MRVWPPANWLLLRLVCSLSPGARRGTARYAGEQVQHVTGTMGTTVVKQEKRCRRGEGGAVLSQAG